ncbi:DUF418 domain-containing protein [Streptomyces poonensis]|nr:DUF418 domain-containing protein [Streptomyces poonensis]
MVFGCAVYGAQLVVSRWWLERYRQGPAEWLLRAITLARPPRRREPAGP